MDDLVATLGLPVIGCMPKPKSKLALLGRTSPMQQRLLQALPSAGKGA